MIADLEKQLESLKNDQRVPLIIAGIFLVFSLTALWQTLSDFISHHTEITAAKIAPIKPLASLSELHLLGLYSSSNLAVLPETTLQLTLQGTVVMSDAPNQSRALIAEPSKPTKVYQVGDILPGNAKVARIAKHDVILNVNGAMQKLSLPIEKLTPDNE